MTEQRNGIQDVGFALLRYPHGLSFIKTAACEVSGDARRQMVIAGTRGTVEIKPLENPVEVPGMLCANQIDCRITYPTSIVAFDQRPEIVRFPPYGRYDAMMEDFCRVVRGEKETDYPPEYEQRVYHLLRRLCPDVK